MFVIQSLHYFQLRIYLMEYLFLHLFNLITYSTTTRNQPILMRTITIFSFFLKSLNRVEGTLITKAGLRVGKRTKPRAGNDTEETTVSKGKGAETKIILERTEVKQCQGRNTVNQYKEIQRHRNDQLVT